jgi:AcrR family transcriptional regulator
MAVSSNARNGASARGGVESGGVAEIQRARIIAGAIEAVAEQGYEGLTVAEVVLRARISRRTFYELYDDREDCFIAALEEALARARGPVVEAYEAGGEAWRGQIEAGLLALLAFCDEQPAYARLLIVDALAAGPAVLEHRAGVVKELVRAVDRGRRDPGRGRDPGPLAAEGIVGAVLAVLHTRLQETPQSQPAPPVPSTGGRRTPNDDRLPTTHGRQPRARRRLSALAGPLMSMIVLPYLGPAAAERELRRPAPRAPRRPAAGRQAPRANPLSGLNMRLTYRTLRVLCVVAEQPGASNRGVANAAGIADQGQTSKLLARLQSLGLIQTTGGGHARGEPNAWTLTARGSEVVEAIGERPAVR